jgi:ketosteroid isomerase-like protein
LTGTDPRPDTSGVSANTDLAQNLFDAIEKGDMETVDRSYHRDATIWHNTDNITKHRDQTIELVKWMNANMPAMRYVDRHCSTTEDGFVERHTVVLTNPDGTVVNLPCCVVAIVADGQITQLYEYFDSAAQSQTGIAIITE